MSVFFIFAAIHFAMVVLIGTDGFLGDRMSAKLRDAEARHMISGIESVQFADTDAFFQFLPLHYREVEWVIYCDKRIPNAALSVFRYEFVQKLWTVSAKYSVPLLYAFHQSVELPGADFHSGRSRPHAALVLHSLHRAWRRGVDGDTCCDWFRNRTLDGRHNIFRPVREGQGDGDREPSMGHCRGSCPRRGALRHFPIRAQGRTQGAESLNRVRFFGIILPNK